MNEKIENINGLHRVSWMWNDKNFYYLKFCGEAQKYEGNLRFPLGEGILYKFINGEPLFISYDDMICHLKEVLSGEDYFEFIYNKHKVTVINYLYNTLKIRHVNILMETVYKLNKYTVVPMYTFDDRSNNVAIKIEDVNAIINKNQVNPLVQNEYTFLFSSNIIDLLPNNLKAEYVVYSIYLEYMKKMEDKNLLSICKKEFYKDLIIEAYNFNLSKNDINAVFKKYPSFLETTKDDLLYYNYKSIESSTMKQIKTSNKVNVIEHTDGNIENMQLTVGQTKFVNTILSADKNSIQICTGGPGTGKTTSISKALSVIDERNKENNKTSSILCLAPTGAATRVLKKAFFVKENLQSKKNIDITVSTIHKYLYIKEVFLYDYIIIDEMSMVDVNTFASLLNKINIKNTRTILVGDEHQLPPVGFGAIFRDIIDAKLLNHNHLTEFKRQEKDSHLMEFIKSFGYSSDSKLSYDDVINIAKDANDIKFDKELKINSDEFVELFNSLSKSNILNSQVICVTNKMTNIINDKVQKSLFSNKEPIFKKGYRKFYKGDKVIFNKNTDGVIQNGTIGVVQGIDDLGLLVKVEDKIEVVTLRQSADIFDDDNEKSVQAYIGDMNLAYAITVHKSQGGTWENIIFVNDYVSKLNSNELIYTAISRAAKSLYIISNDNIMSNGYSLSINKSKLSYSQNIK